MRLDEWGYGLSSVRFICGTQDLHKELGLAPTKVAPAPTTARRPYLYRPRFSGRGAALAEVSGPV